MVQHRPDPANRGRLKELARNHDPALMNVAGSQHSLLGAVAPHHPVAIQLVPLGKKLPAQAAPHLIEKRIALRLLATRGPAGGEEKLYLPYDLSHAAA
jgi:hypothetical protein